ncbi:MAG: 16S rRNA processing protein RimM [Flavobacteriales bacterium]|nr:16S rRNA processing protein RimM [Flavobacteriales bacterium]
MESIGKVLKPHGYKGELTIYLEADRIVDPMELPVIYLDMQGMPVPYVVEDIANKGKGQFKVRLKGVTTEAAALLLVKKAVSIDDDHLYEEEEDPIIGYTLIDQKLGEIGTVTGIMEIPGNQLIRVDRNGTEVLIPDNDEVIVEIDDDARTILVNCPDGLIDLNA